MRSPRRKSPNRMKRSKRRRNQSPRRSKRRRRKSPRRSRKRRSKRSRRKRRSPKRRRNQSPRRSRRKSSRVNKSRLSCNRPVKSSRPEKKKMVLACSRGRKKLVHYGATGYGNNYSAAARRSFKARHKCSAAHDKLSARYWACKDLWAGPGGDTRQPPR